MKRLLQTEQIAQLLICAIALYYLPLQLNWWMYLLLFFAPDLSMIGYGVNTKVGAVMYNIAHHNLVAAGVVVLGMFMIQDFLMLIGILLWAHSAFDRILGYGLKHSDSFQNTHLGWIGKKD